MPMVPLETRSGWSEGVMLNISEELSNFKTINVESLERKIGTIPDDMKNAIDLYNQALEDICGKNEDIAVIALKKAISIYPEFYEAMNLMGVCYDSMGDEENARTMFNRVIQMDDSSIRAARYLEQMDIGASSAGVKNKASNNKPAKNKSLGSKLSRNKFLQNKPDKPANEISDREGVPEAAANGPNIASLFAAWLRRGLEREGDHPYYLKYIIGFILGALIVLMIWLLIPGGKSLNVDFSNMFGKSGELSPQVEQLQKENSDLNGRLTEALGALETAKETEKQLQDQMDQYIKWSVTLRELQKLADEEKYMDVVIEIDKNLAGLDLPEKLKAEFNDLSETCKPKSVGQFYESAMQKYQSNRDAKDPKAFKESADLFRMAVKIIDELEEKPSYAVQVYYYGGKAISLSESPNKEEANKEAVDCFGKVISTAPGSKFASYAQARINEINAGESLRP